VGVSKGAERGLFIGHMWWIEDTGFVESNRQAVSSAVAREVESYFNHMLGTDGGRGGERHRHGLRYRRTDTPNGWVKDTVDGRGKR